MKKNIITLLLLSIAVMAGVIFLSGCTKEDTLTPQDFAPPTNFRALSQTGAVVLYWTRSTDDGVSSFTGYRVMTFAGTTKIDSFMTTQDTARISGLTNGASYKFKIWSVKSNGDVSIADSLDWGPVNKFGSPARIYEYDSPQPSGVQFSSANSFSFTSSSPDNRGNIDLWVDGRSGTDLLIKSPSDEDFSSTGWRATKLYETSATSLETPVSIPASGSFRTTPGYTITANHVYLAITADGHYVRFQVSAVQGTAPNRYIDITIFYNSTTNPWAKK